MGRHIGQMPPLKPQQIWAIRVRLQLQGRARVLAMFNLALDSKLRACDLVSLRVNDVINVDGIASRAQIVQRKTGRPVQFETTRTTRDTLGTWIEAKGLVASQSVSEPS